MSFKYLFNIGYNKNILQQGIPQDVSRVINGAPVNEYLSGLITPDFQGLAEQQHEESYVTQNDDLKTVPGPDLALLENQAAEISSNNDVAQELGFDPNKGRSALYSKQLNAYLAEIFGVKGFNQSGKKGFSLKRYKEAVAYFDEQFEKDWKATEKTRRNEYMAKQREPLLAQTIAQNDKAILEKEKTHYFDGTNWIKSPTFDSNKVTFSGFNGNMQRWGSRLQKVFNDNKDSEIWKQMAGDDSDISLEEFKAWQKNKGLSLVDGKIGRQTLQAMGFDNKNYDWLNYIPNSADRWNQANLQSRINRTLDYVDRVTQNVTSTPNFSLLNTQDRTTELSGESSEESRLHEEGERLYGKNNYIINDDGSIQQSRISVKGNKMYSNGVPIKSIIVNGETMPVGSRTPNGRVYAKSRNSDIYTVDSSTGRIHKVGDASGYIKDAYYSFKQGGNINKFNQGNKMSTDKNTKKEKPAGYSFSSRTQTFTPGYSLTNQTFFPYYVKDQDTAKKLFYQKINSSKPFNDEESKKAYDRAKIHKNAGGGIMNQQNEQQELQFALMGYVVATKKQPKDDKEINMIVQQLMQLKQKDPKQYNQLVQVGQQAYTQMNNQKNAQLAERGSKLNYIRRLKGLCPDGQETYFFKDGGMIKSGCKPCMAKAQKGQELKKKGNAVQDFKNKRKHINENDTIHTKYGVRDLNGNTKYPKWNPDKENYTTRERQRVVEKDQESGKKIKVDACGGKAKKKK